jgi:tetratricopeptide (TPR) repeat protein
MQSARTLRGLFGIFLLLATSLFAGTEDTWTEIKSPNFTVISNASPKQARRVARSFEQFRQLIRTVMSHLKADPGSPLRVFALKDSKSLKAILPIREGKGAAELSGLFMSHMESHFVALSLDVPEERAYHTIYHEYVHLVMRLNFQQMPLWLSEGLAELYGYAKLSDEESTLGNVSPDLIRTLKMYSMMPLQVLMTVTPDSPYYRQGDKARVFYAQSWALTHYLLLGDRAAHAGQLNEYLRQIQNGVPEREAAAQTLGDLGSLQQNLANYVRSASSFHYQVPALLDVKEEEYTARILSQAESLALRGQFLIGTGRTEEAKAMLEEAIQLDPGNADAREGRGLLFLTLGNREKAGEYFLAAARLNSRSSMAHFYAAQSEYQRGEDYRAAENHLRKALEINPKFVPAMSLLAHIVSLQKDKLPEALNLTIEAVSLEPAEMRHRINQAEILIGMERYAEASRLAEHVLQIASSDADRNLATSVLSRIKEKQEWILEARRRQEAEDERRQGMAKELERIRGEEIRQSAEVERRLAESSKQEPIHKPALKGGPIAKAIGIIKSVKCDSPAIMDVVLDSDGKQRTYRAENYYRVQYWAVGAPGKTGFEPCEELKGKRVQIEFQSIAGQKFSGLIQAVAVEK